MVSLDGDGGFGIGLFRAMIMMTMMVVVVVNGAGIVSGGRCRSALHSCDRHTWTAIEVLYTPVVCSSGRYGASPYPKKVGGYVLISEVSYYSLFNIDSVY